VTEPGKGRINVSMGGGRNFSTASAARGGDKIGKKSSGGTRAKKEEGKKVYCSKGFFGGNKSPERNRRNKGGGSSEQDTRKDITFDHFVSAKKGAVQEGSLTKKRKTKISEGIKRGSRRHHLCRYVIRCRERELEEKRGQTGRICYGNLKHLVLICAVGGGGDKKDWEKDGENRGGKSARGARGAFCLLRPESVGCSNRRVPKGGKRAERELRFVLC